MAVMTRGSVPSHIAQTSPAPGMSNDQVSFFARGMVVEDLETGDVSNLMVVPVALADPSRWQISDISPVGAALRHSKVGDIVVVPVPVGTVRYRVLSNVNEGR